MHFIRFFTEYICGSSVSGVLAGKKFIRMPSGLEIIMDCNFVDPKSLGSSAFSLLTVNLSKKQILPWTL